MFVPVYGIIRSYIDFLVRIRGPHHQFRNVAENTFTIPKRNPVRMVYVKQMLRLIGRALVLPLPLHQVYPSLLCMANVDKKDLQYYLDLPYIIMLQKIRDESGKY